METMLFAFSELGLVDHVLDLLDRTAMKQLDDDAPVFMATYSTGFWFDDRTKNYHPRNLRFQFYQWMPPLRSAACLRSRYASLAHN